jgi:hypothetical protein
LLLTETKHRHPPFSKHLELKKGCSLFVPNKNGPDRSVGAGSAPKWTNQLGAFRGTLNSMVVFLNVVTVFVMTLMVMSMMMIIIVVSLTHTCVIGDIDKDVACLSLLDQGFGICI